MDIVRISSHGQVVIPKAIRTRQRWRTGTELVIEERNDGLMLRPANPFAPTRLEDGLGCVGYQGPTIDLDQMDADALGTLSEAWAEDDR
jgi:AbrB family looped-hinge helix DNA binding protein